jgi:hypothetical protein
LGYLATAFIYGKKLVLIDEKQERWEILIEKARTLFGNLYFKLSFVQVCDAAVFSVCLAYFER